MKTYYLKLLLLFLFLGIYSFSYTNDIPKASHSLDFKVGGQIKGEDGTSLVGVTIREKNTNNGTLSDEQGNFSIEVADENAVLIFSYYGFDDQEVEVNGQNSLEITMGKNISTLDEVVVVGYGTQRKRFVTSSIAKINQDELADVPNISVQSTLQGRAAGVQVTTSDAMAGAPVLIRIRGTSSVTASSEPLYVVDGIPIVSGNFSVNNASNWQLATANETNALSQLNPADIESIEILKDASAAAIYGARATNGVVLITTKQGREGKTKFNAGIYSGFTKETNRIELLDGPTYIDLAKEAWLNAGNSEENDFEALWRNLLPSGLTREVAEQTNTDWLDQALQRGEVTEANLSASGGNAKTTFYLGGTYRKETGIFKGNSFDRFNARVNFDHKVNDKISLGARNAFTFVDNDRIPIAWAGGLGVAQSTALPYYPIYNADGSFFNPKAGYNVVAELENTEMNRKSSSILSNVYAQVMILPGLSLRGEFGINNIYGRENYYRSAVIEDQAIATRVLSENINWNTNNTLNYSAVFANSALDITAGMNAQSSYYSANIINGEGFANPSLKNPENAASQTASVQETEFRFVSFFSRVNYRIKDRYLLSATIRRDGSSRFGIQNRWGTFPAFSAGYILSEESFLQSFKPINFLKIRFGYGNTGNAEIGNFLYFGSYQTSNYVNNSGIVVNEIDNFELGWENATQYDLGIDFGLFNDRIQGTVDLYLKNTDDLLLGVGLSALTGAETVTTNIGSLENKGIEVDITTYNLKGKFNWNSNFNLSYNQNTVTKLAPNIAFAGLFGGGSTIEVGYPVGVRELVRWHGVASSDMTLQVTDPGTMEQISIDVKGGDNLYLNQFDEVTNIYDPQDAAFVGSAYPLWVGGISNQFEFKGLDFSFLFNFALGHDIENSEQQNQLEPFGFGWNSWASIQNRWQNPGDETDFGRIIWGGPGRGRTSTRYLYSADYLRLRDVTIGYTLPQELLQKIGLDHARIFVKGTNVLTFTDYPGWDPEYNRDGADSDNFGKSWLPSPQAKAFTAGVNISF